ncbi:hypothetical protein TcCL_NonESM12989 [Trypanosoma cruzi]|nr:hypothetical protein TcCL_NonESM12989 [Trypanosoma cruzi]
MLVLLMVHCGHTLLPATPHVELQRRSHHKSHGEVPSQHPCGEASHSHRQTAASRHRWLQRTVAAVSSRCPKGVGRGTRTAGRSVRHAAALQRLSVKQSRPATNPNTATISPFLFCFIHVFCRFAPSLTQKISAHLHKREGTKRKKTRSHRPAAGQHSPPHTTITAQETAATSQSQHQNVHHTIVQ